MMGNLNTHEVVEKERTEHVAVLNSEEGQSWLILPRESAPHAREEVEQGHSEVLNDYPDLAKESELARLLNNDDSSRLRKLFESLDLKGREPASGQSFRAAPVV